MRFKTTLVLLGIVAAVALVFVLLERPHHERALERARREGLLTDVKPSDVHRMTITRPDVTIEAEREGDHWNLVSPVADRADDSAVNTLLDAVCKARAGEEFDAGDSPRSEFGLDSLSAAVRLRRESGEDILDLRIGELSLTKSHCYAALPARDRVFLLPAGVRRYALRPLFEFRYKRIFDEPVSGVHRLEIASESRSMVWNTDKNGQWITVENGDTIAGDAASLESVVRTLRGLRAKDIPFGVPAPAGGYLATRAGTISVGFEPDSTDVSFSFGNPLAQGCYVESSATGRIALVDTPILNVFLETIGTLRDRRFFRSGLDAVVKMTLETPRFTVTLLEADAKWTFENPQFGSLDAEAARGLFSQIQSLKFDTVLHETYRDAGAYGFERPALRLTLFGARGRSLDELVVGDSAPDGFSRYAWSRSTGALATIDAVTLSAFEKSFGVPTAP